MTCLVRALAAHPIKTSTRWRNFSQPCIAMIIEASKPEFGSLINLLLHFILNVSALQLMRWLQSYDGLKFCATVRVRSEVRWQNSGAEFDGGGRIRDHVIFIYLLSRRAPKTFVYLLSRRVSKTFLNNTPTYLPACLPACLSIYLPTYLPACLPACLPAYLSACLPIRPVYSICLFDLPIQPTS